MALVDVLSENLLLNVCYVFGFWHFLSIPIVKMYFNLHKLVFFSWIFFQLFYFVSGICHRDTIRSSPIIKNLQKI